MSTTDGVCAHELGVVALRDAYRAGERSPREDVEALLRRIADVDPLLGAFVELDAARARRDALAAERRLQRGEGGALEGVAVGVKDVIDVSGMRCEHGSRAFAGRRPAADATVVARLRAAGAIVLGKTATHELAWGVTTRSDAGRATRNPWDPARTAGGSSGGSGAAVAARLVPFALGTDTGGSVRIPAALCGVAGLRPTHGAVPVDGVLPVSRTLDAVGALARDPRDLAAVWPVLSGARPGVDLAPARALAGARLGVCPDLHPTRPAPASARAFDALCDVLAGAGAALRVVRLPEARDALMTFVAIQGFEAIGEHRALGLWPARADAYGADVRERAVRAERVTPEQYAAARARARDLDRALDRALEGVDALLSLAAPVPPLRADAPEPADYRRGLIACNAFQPLTGSPALAFRAGFDDDGLPVGAQLTAGRGRERTLLALAAAVHDATPRVQSREPCVHVARQPDEGAT